MTTRVTDEMLMAFVDGELDPAAAESVRRATANDAALARRAEAFRTTRQMARDAFVDLKAEPVPEALVAAVLRGESSKVVAFSSRRRFMQTALPIAASIAIAFGLAGYWFGQRSAPGGADPLGGGIVAEALGETPSGNERTIRASNGEARLRTLATYKVDRGLCRTFEMSPAGSQGAVRGVGCDLGSGWNVGMAAAHGGDGTYAPAAAGATGSIDAYLDALDAQGPLSPEEEAVIIGDKGR
ncbi:MAG: hypothetical protein WD871_11425 [Xanthobacteraceae bacterium]